MSLRSIITNNNNSGAIYVALPSRNKIKWLIPISHNNQFTIRRLYNPQNLFVKLSIVTSRISSPFGNYVSVDQDELEDLKQLFGFLNPFQLAIYLGSTGTYSKVTVAAIDDYGYPLAYAKVSESKYSDEVLRNEEKILGKLKRIEKLNGAVPIVLNSCLWREKFALILSPGSGEVNTSRYNNNVKNWLINLFTNTQRYRMFEESDYWMKTQEKYSKIGYLLPIDWQNRYRISFRRLRDDFKGIIMPFGVAHRDFAPWNICSRENGLFVFDWEMAHEDYPPLYDFFHFFAIQAALKRRKAVNNQKYAKELIQTLWPDGSDLLDELYLAYLVDQSMFYLEAKLISPEVGEDRVSFWIANEIDHLLRIH